MWRLARRRLIGSREIDPDHALPLDAGIGTAADLGEVHLLAFAQRGNLHAGAVHVEAPAVVAASDGLAVEPAVMERDAAMRTDVAQREDLGPAAAPDEQPLAEQRLCHHAAGPQVGAKERNVPQTAQKFGFEILHGPVPEMPKRPRRYTGISARRGNPWARVF
jgi:hypothetical protein